MSSILSPAQDAAVAELATAKLHELFAKYAGNDHALARIHGIVCNQLPQMVDAFERTRVQRKTRMDDLVSTQNAFVHLFMANNRYFYCERTDKFFYYDLDRYFPYSEDDILYSILSTISQSQADLMDWKQRTRIVVMQRIKKNTMLDTVPESCTIQRVLDLLHPALFPSRADAKYFLTVLGDNLRKINTGLVHFVDIRAKEFIRALSQSSADVFGLNSHHSFKHKYHPEHDYASCRLIRANPCVSLSANWRFLNEHSLDIFVVAAHYSARYGGSDGFLSDSIDGESIYPKVCILRNKTPDSLVAAFILEYLEVDADASACGISWKTVQYLWQKFLDANRIPCVLFQQPLKERLIFQMGEHYSAESDGFMGVFSRVISDSIEFLTFWDAEMVLDAAETDLETDEIARLFRRSGGIRGLSGDRVAEIIAHYRVDIVIRDRSRVDGVRCRLWDKRADIDAAMAEFREKLGTAQITPEEPWTSLYATTLYEMYVYYSKNCGANAMVVNKEYFDRYICETLGEVVVDSEFVKIEWLNADILQR
jgi:hypothetical protein